MRSKTEKHFIKSAGGKIYVELGYPRQKLPRPAIIIAHGLRSYYPGFLDMFAKTVREAGFISVKFHFLGTGKSDGKFEDKTTGAMLKNYEDVLDFLDKYKDISSIGMVGRSNAGILAIIHGPDPRIKAYSLLAPAAYFSMAMEKFVKTSTVKGKFFYHKSYKRKHTKGEGRLPFTFVDEIKKFELFKKAHILLHASVKEGWGLVVIEAASQVTPSVVYDVAGLRDSVKNGKTGVVLSENSCKEMAKEAVALFKDNKKYQAFQKNGLAWAKSLTWDKATRQSLNLINSL